MFGPYIFEAAPQPRLHHSPWKESVAGGTALLAAATATIDALGRRSSASAENRVRDGF